MAGDNKGIALIAVLWGLLLLSLIAAGVLNGARSEAQLTRSALEAAKARALADAGVRRAILALSGPEIEAGWRRDGTPVAWPFGEGEVSISIRDEAGKVDLNRAPVRLLKGLFAAAGLDARDAAALADAVADFRDDNDLKRLNGAEDRDYRAAGRERGAKDAPFDRIEELRQVLGMTPALFARVRHAVTVHARRARIDPQSAPRLALLAASDRDPDAVEVFLERRAAEGGEAEVGVLDVSASPDLLSSGRPSKTFGIRAEARTAAGTVFVRRAVVRIRRNTGRMARIESWE